jgi:two-component system CheB/CheR fusion protein
MVEQVQAHGDAAPGVRRRATKGSPAAIVGAVTPRRAAGGARHPFPIVAIGASAGGLEALEQFLGHVPAAGDMAFVIIQHLDPTQKGMMPELLQRVTAMPVAQARNRMKVQPGCVYVIPPNRDLSILRDSLHLLEPVAPRGLRLPIDFFFRALADDRREHAIGVVLSGMGSDGALGVLAIKEHGGLVLAQDPASAKFDSMPRSAIDTGVVDIVAGAALLPQRIADCLRHARRTVPGPDGHDAEVVTEGSALDQVCILLRARTGHDFSRYKKSTLHRRIERRMAIHLIDRLPAYVRTLRDNPQEADFLFKELLIGVTRFFRDPASWSSLAETALQPLVAACPDGARLRAWVAGCSTGEEAYSLAIAFHEASAPMATGRRPALQVFATDLDADAIARARQGYYPGNIAADVSAERLRRYFVEEGIGYRIGKEIREMVVFAPQNVIMDPPFTKLDILTCRNLLIYLGAELQKTLLPLFHYSLRPGGILMLGSAESIGGFNDLFAPLDAKARLFRRRDGPQPNDSLEFPTRAFPTQSEAPMATPHESPPNLQQLADQLLLQRFSPAAVLVNGDGDIVYISGRTGRYLEPAAGKANWNIVAMARDGLRQQIALALPKALRGGEPASCRGLRVGSNGDSLVVDVTIHPVLEPPLRGMAMIVFAEFVAPPEAAADAATAAPLSRHRSPRMTELARALTRAQQELRALRDEMQISQEELKAANEELQSTNEELTTSKEELQSLNEEMQTVNVELQSKLDELSTANNDMKNLLNSTDIATVFLDGALHIRRYTTQATRLFKLIPSDIGRPLSDIVTDLDYADLLTDADAVLRSLALSDREIATADGRWYQVKIMPYRTMDNVIDGVVITCTDIRRAKELEARLRDDAAVGKDPR